MARTSGVSAKQLRLLGRLTSLPALSRSYLAGGTAIGWYFGHRRSMDLDLFLSGDADSLERAVESLVSMGGAVKSRTDVAATLEVSGVVVDVVRYPYPPLRKPAKGPAEFPVASPLDLAVMKLAAIARRGLRRDFWDLHVIVTQGRVTLPAALDGYRERYRRSASDLYHVARALTFFDDAERDDVRVIGLTNRSWLDIKAWFTKRAQALLK